MAKTNQASPAPGPLAGVRVLDLSRVLAGPWATQALADLGAQVIKIERPGAGDDTRHWGPPFAVDPDGGQGDAAYFFAANRGKRSVTVDIARPEGAALVRALAARADVLVENFKVGGLGKYGLDYPSLALANPRLVYCSITGFGQTGPDAGRAGYDYMIQAMGGLMSVTGEPGRPPVKVGVAVADLFAGLYASNAILAALLHARATGEGQQIDIALFEAQAAMLANQATNWFVSGEVPGPMGGAHPNLAPYQPLPTRDGALVVAVGNDGQFQALCRGLDAAELAADPRFGTNALRVGNRTELTSALEALTSRLGSRELTRALAAAGVPCSPINTVDQVFAEPQAKARGLVVEQHRGGQTVRTVASPMRLAKTPASYEVPPPALGADTDRVLQDELGLSAAEIERLREARVI
jgi:crotonobetainyl-CoA:carnitine CoA-transferase CaiB-like acyl-CoA transferase